MRQSQGMCLSNLQGFDHNRILQRRRWKDRRSRISTSSSCRTWVRTRIGRDWEGFWKGEFRFTAGPRLTMDDGLEKWNGTKHASSNPGPQYPGRGRNGAEQ